MRTAALLINQSCTTTLQVADRQTALRRALTSALVLFCSVTSLSAGPGKTEILWDTYGIPHIYAANRTAMFRAHGWAQMRNQSSLLLQLYGESRGRGAEYWGPDHLDLDRWVQINRVPERARAWYNAQDPTFRAYLDAFAEGINDFARQHPEAVDPKYRVVLPVSGIDVVGHSLRVVHYMYMGSQGELKKEVEQARSSNQVSFILPHTLTNEQSETTPGSNTWAIGPYHSASGKAMLLINPHLAWGNTFFRYMEVHLTAPDYDLYGAPQIGFPVPVVGFNRRAGWGRTVNTLDTVDFYRLTTAPGGYLLDGATKSFEQETKTLKIRQPDGTIREESLHIKRSVHGPVVYDQNGLTVAMRVVGLDRPRMLEQWFRMGEAQNLPQFRAALQMMSVPMWNANYADADGHILLTFDGLLPRRNQGDFNYWSHLVPGDTSKTLWTGYHDLKDLPQSLDPSSGFNQNENEAPWFSTLPPLEPSRFATYLAPGLQFMPTYRTQRSLRMITDPKPISFDQFLLDKHSTRMEAADAILPDLLKAAESSADPFVVKAAAVLKQWDRSTNAESRGAVLFEIFFNQHFGSSGGIDPLLRVKYDPADYLHSAYGLADLQAALASLQKAAGICLATYGALDIPWGDVYRFRSGSTEAPGNGGPGRLGVFRTITYGKKENKRAYAVHGETFVCAIEFGTPQRAQCALSYGNSSQPSSPHLADQLPLMTARKLHPVWRDRNEVSKHLEVREAF